MGDVLPRISAASIAAAALAALVFAVQAQPKYPDKPVRVILGTTAGGQPDMLARLIVQKMSDTWGQAVVVDNRAGAGGTLAAAAVARAAADGYTLLYAIPSFTISPALQPVPYDPVKDFTHVSQIGMTTNVLVASPSLGVRSVKELITRAKAQPGKLIFATSAVGSAAHLSGARFNMIAGIKIVQVAYKGGPEAVIEVLGGRAQYHLGTMGTNLPFIKEGKLVALGVTTPQRATVLPDVPALGELMAEFKRPETTHGLLAPARTPRAIVNQLNKEIVRILDLPDIRERTQAIAFVTMPSTPEEYGTIVRGQVEALRTLVVEAGLKPK